MRDLSAEIRAALDNRALQDSLAKATTGSVELRDRAIHALGRFSTARDRARAIKEQAIEELPHLIEILEASVSAAGGHVHRAADATAACRHIVGIARRHAVRSAVKSKSMTSEEVHLNQALMDAGVAVRETDLGEFVVQLAGDRPSHIIAPIIHMGLEDVRRVFREHLSLSEVPRRAEGLTQIARTRLRREFLAAGMGITGANFLIADSGTIVIVENEGNARMCTQVPRLQVALVGVEKILPTLADLEPFLELLPRSATGQLATCYVSFISGPGWSDSPLVAGVREFHLVLLDNGRLQMRDDPVLREALYCIRCGVCMNACPPYQVVGGHVYGGPTYQSGIGNAWEAGVRGLDTAAEFNQLCTTCSRCRDLCPVNIDIPWMNSVLRARIAAGRPDISARFFSDPARLYRWARRTAPLSAWLASWRPVRRALHRWVALDETRPLPLPDRQTLRRWHRRRRSSVPGSMPEAPTSVVETDDRVEADRIVLFADCHSDYLDLGVGKAAVSILEWLGKQVVVVGGGCCGRAALSQGMLDKARRQASALQELLETSLADGQTIVGLEPSCLSCVVQDHHKLIPDDPRVVAAAGRCRDLMEYLVGQGAGLRQLMQQSTQRRSAEPRQRTVIVHGHCQQKTAGWWPATLEVLRGLPGLTVQETKAQCCGMAGSFGYKVGFRALSTELGRRLVREIESLEAAALTPAEAAAINGPRDTASASGETPGEVREAELLACGTSCRAQVRELGGRRCRHPVEYLADLLDVDRSQEPEPRQIDGC